MVKLRLSFLLLAIMLGITGRAQRIASVDLPFIGAQVFIEPGQTEEQIDQWFAVMEQCGMTVCRIRMFQQYMERADGSWDFSLFDHAFRSAQRHNIKVYATFFPTTARTDIGGWKFPRDQSQHDGFMHFVRVLVEHYAQHPALKGWVLINEPGSDGYLPDSDYIGRAYQGWEAEHPDAEFDAEGFPILTAPRRQAFIYDLTTQYLATIAAEVKRIDNVHDVHVNPANVFGNYGEYDFTGWQQFLTSLGGSAHPSWHYGLFPRSRYAHAMAIEAEMLRSAAGRLPWFMTEIQGGNNIYSGGRAICPTPQEVAQWLWTVIGTEGKGGVFWTLNPRSAGIEAGEWAMIDFLVRPSSRMLAARDVAHALQSEADFFIGAKQQLSGIDIVYAKESRWAEQLMRQSASDPFVGRRDNAVFRSMAACHQALADRGIQASLTSLDQYDFSLPDYRGRTIILTHQIALPLSARDLLTRFVQRGGTLIVEGLTAYFDQNLHCTMLGSYWESLLGGRVSEFVCADGYPRLESCQISLPYHWQQGVLADSDATTLTRTLGQGRVVWFPSCIALGAACSDDYQPLSDWLCSVVAPSSGIRFDCYHKDVLLRVLTNRSEVITICINKSDSVQEFSLEGLKPDTLPEVIFCNGKSCINNSQIQLYPEDVMVIKWK